MTAPEPSDVTALILAGGRGERMGGLDKGLIEVNGQRVVERIVAKLTPQVQRLLINANRNLDDYRSLGFPVVEDTMEDFQGPLAGLLTGLKHTSTSHVLTLPCDAPGMPENLVKRMCDSLAGGGELAVAHDGERFQPVYALVPVSLLDSLQRFLQAGDRKIMLWYKQHKMVKADFSDQQDTFHNINTPADKAVLEERP